MKKSHILIVEDEQEIAVAIEAYLLNQGYLVTLASNGIEALEVVYSQSIDLAIVDVMMPKMGADDYVTKPFRPLELLARVNSQLRRYQRFSAINPENQQNILTIGGLELNMETKEFTVDGSLVRLTPIEYKILNLLMRHPGRVFPAEEIYERIWNETAVNTDTIMVHIRNIREKIEINPKKPKYLKVVWGVGYKIEKQ